MSAEHLAKLHQESAPSHRLWSQKEYRSLLNAKSTCLELDKNGFALGQVMQQEAELLMIAVRASLQGHGLGYALLTRFEASLVRKTVTQCFLEVSDVNEAAKNLYFKSGYKEIGRRKNYYKEAGNQRSDALILRKDLIL